MSKISNDKLEKQTEIIHKTLSINQFGKSRFIIIKFVNKELIPQPPSLNKRRGV